MCGGKAAAPLRNTSFKEETPSLSSDYFFFPLVLSHRPQQSVPGAEWGREGVLGGDALLSLLPK